MGLELAKALDLTHLKVFGDSKLIINKVNMIYDAKKPNILPYHNTTCSLVKDFTQIQLEYITRGRIPENML